MIQDRAIHRIPRDKIRHGDRLRPTDPDWAAAIAHSMAERGQDDPIEVTPPNKDGFYDLVAGAHRDAAAGLLEWVEIDAVFFDGDEHERRLREIDENLYRHELNALDRAVFLAMRKEIYEAKHPETKAGVAGGKARQGEANETISFADATAERTGLDKRTIQMSVRIYTKLAPKVRAKIAGTKLARNQSELLNLVKNEHKVQAKIVGMLLREKDPAPSVNAALKVIEGHKVEEVDSADAQHRRLMASWNHAKSIKAKRRFLEEIQVEIEFQDILSDLGWVSTLAEAAE